MWLVPRFTGFLSLDGKTRQWNGCLSYILCVQTSCPNLIPSACGSIKVGGGRRGLVESSTPEWGSGLGGTARAKCSSSPSLYPASFRALRPAITTTPPQSPAAATRNLQGRMIHISIRSVCWWFPISFPGLTPGSGIKALTAKYQFGIFTWVSNRHLFFFSCDENS